MSCLVLHTSVDMDATRLYLADCVGVTVFPISRIIIPSAYKELKKMIIIEIKSHYN